MAEKRETLFITYAYDDPDAPVLDISGSLAEARHAIRSHAWEGYCYRVRRQDDGTYGDETFIQVLSPVLAGKE